MADGKLWLAVALGLAVAAVLGLLLMGGNGEPTVPETEPAVSVEVEETDGTIQALIQPEMSIGEADDPVFFIIEENHASLAVQQEVGRAIQIVARVIPDVVVLIEGTAPGELDLSPPELDVVSQEWKLATAEAWFELGWLSGVEMASLTDPELTVWGAEVPGSQARVDHREALNQRGDAQNESFSLFERWRDDTPGYGTEHDEELFEAATSLVAALVASEAPLTEGMPLDEAMRRVSDHLLTDRTLHRALSRLAEEHEPATDTHVARTATEREAWRRFFEASVRAAEGQGLVETAEAEELLERYWNAHEREEDARARRHRDILESSLQALREAGSNVGALVIGAGHTSELTTYLRDRGITHVVITPVSLSAVTPTREIARFEELLDRWEEGNPAEPISEWLTQSGFKASVTLADERSLETFSAVCLLLEAADRALRGESVVDIAAGHVIDRVEFERTAEAVVIKVFGTGQRSLVWELPHDFRLTESAAAELVKHTLESTEAGSLLKPREEDGFFSPAAHIYLEPDGIHGGAFVSHMPDAETLVTQAVPLTLPASAQEVVWEHGQELQAPSREHLDDLLAPAAILRPVAELLNRTLDDLGIPDDAVTPVVLRMGRVSDEEIIRDINFTVLAEIARRADIEGFRRRLMFVKCGLEQDSERILVGNPERLLASALANAHAWGKTQRHVAVFTIPTEGTQSEWRANPYARYLEEQLRKQYGFSPAEARAWYEDHMLPHVEAAMRQIGDDNILQPETLEELVEQLEGALHDVGDAAVSITLVGHRLEGEPGTWVHFRGEESGKPLEAVVSEIRTLQDRGVIPASAKLDFNVLVCSAEEEAAPRFIKDLRARLVLASPREIGVATNMKLLRHQAAGLAEGLPTYLAYFRAVESVVEAFFTDEVPSLELNEPSVKDHQQVGGTTHG